MAEDLKILERFCRLCAEEQEATLMLYSKECADMLLLEKLRKYLQVEISENEKLPKNICIKCCSTLQTLCDFIDQIHTAQKNLKTLTSATEMRETDSTLTTIYAIKEEPTEFTEICIDPMEVYMPEETFTVNNKNSYSEEVVTLKLIGKNEENQNNNQDSNPSKKPFICEVCKKSFLKEQSLKNHSWTHIQDEDYTCFTCQKSFRFQADLNKHIKTHTRKCFKFSCNICGRRFKTDKPYQAHMRLHNSTKQKFTCEHCGRSYAYMTGLKTHMVSHSSEKPHKCNLCDKKFKRNHELKFHMNSHTGAKPYKCKQCDVSFASSGNLYAHRLVHLKQKKLLIDLNKSIRTKFLSRETRSYKYYCPICEKGFQRHENYVYHMFQHTGVKPFKCTQCTQHFITQRSLSSHYDKVHPTIGKPAMPMPVFCPK